MAGTGKAKVIIAIVAAVVLVVGVVAGTLAFFADSDSATNTFTVGKVEIKLDETAPQDNTAELIPGTTIEKNPTITVVKGSSDCWVFAKMEASENCSDFLGYSIASGWQQGDGTRIPKSVYYQSVSKSDVDTVLPILANNEVQVLDTVTKEKLQSIQTSGNPALSFIGYACQKSGFDNAADAWEEVSKLG